MKQLLSVSCNLLPFQKMIFHIVFVILVSTFPRLYGSLSCNDTVSWIKFIIYSNTNFNWIKHCVSNLCYPIVIYAFNHYN